MEQRSFLKALRSIMLVLVIAGCASKPEVVTAPPAAVTSGVSDDQLDAAVRETSDYLNANLTKGNKLVVLNIQSEFPALSEYIIDELIANTVNDRVFTVVDRRQLDTIRAELDFQYSGEVDDDTMQALGRMAGAQIIVSGAVSKIGDLYRLRVRALGVQTARIEGQFNRNIPDGPTVAALARSQATGYGDSGGRPAAASTKPARAAQAPAATAEPAVPVVVAAAPAPATYNIGDKGPAAGIVFYDKGAFFDGWQYLEAAPRDVGSGAPWSAHSVRVDGTSTAAGSGKRNTELIVNTLQESGGSAAAAQVASYYSQGGYSDWFLPSRDELDFMYKNLKQKNLGGFSSGWYWSSSAGEYSQWSWAQLFSNGSQVGFNDSNTVKNHGNMVRAVRQF
jgi:TolB-like protein